MLLDSNTGGDPQPCLSLCQSLAQCGCTFHWVHCCCLPPLQRLLPPLQRLLPLSSQLTFPRHLVSILGPFLPSSTLTAPELKAPLLVRRFTLETRKCLSLKASVASCFSSKPSPELILFCQSSWVSGFMALAWITPPCPFQSLLPGFTSVAPHNCLFCLCILWVLPPGISLCLPSFGECLHTLWGQFGIVSFYRLGEVSLVLLCPCMGMRACFL